MVVSGNWGLYRRNHWVHASISYEAKVTPGLLSAASLGLSIRRVTLDDWPALAPLYQAGAAHFVRPADLEQDVCFWWNRNNKNLDIYLIEADGRPLGYMAVG